MQAKQSSGIALTIQTKEEKIHLHINWTYPQEFLSRGRQASVLKCSCKLERSSCYGFSILSDDLIYDNHYGVPPSLCIDMFSLRLYVDEVQQCSEFSMDGDGTETAMLHR